MKEHKKNTSKLSIKSSLDDLFKKKSHGKIKKDKDTESKEVNGGSKEGKAVTTIESKLKKKHMKTDIK